MHSSARPSRLCFLGIWLVLCALVSRAELAESFTSHGNKPFGRLGQITPKTFLVQLKGGVSSRGNNSNSEIRLGSKVQQGDETLPVKPKKKGSRLRDALFPIYGSHELKKFFTISMINFFIVFVLVITRDAKDTLVVTSCGAEAISFLKLYGVLPAATLFMLGYSKASTVLSKPRLFYGTAAPFFLFYLLFDLAIYPLRGQLHPAPGTLRLPGGLAYLSKILENWTFALYYVVSEVYSAMSIGVLFWQHANDIVSVKQAKRFYPLFGQISSLAPILAGQCGVWLASKATFEQSLHYLTGLIGASGLAVGALYAYSLRLVARERAAAAAEGRELGLGVPPKKKKEKLGLLESLRVLSRSEYLGCLATLVVAYGLAINFSDILFKSVLKLKYPEKLDYQRFMGNFTTMVGVATFLVIFVGANVVKHLGWSAGALITPLTMAAVGLPFFGTICLGDRGSPAGLNFAVALGAAQTLLSKAAKFSFFDPTTQMAYIPLGEEEKVKGKAAIDGLGSRLGKSGGALAQQALVLVAGSVLGAAPAIAVIYYGVLLAWMGAVARLSKLFAAATAKREGEEAAEEEAAARSRGGVAAATGGGRP